MITKEIRKKVEQELQIDLERRGENGRLIRKRDYVYARSVYYSLCDKLTPMSLEAIGRTLGQDHATVLHCIRKIMHNLELWGEKKYLDLHAELLEELMPLKIQLKEQMKDQKDYVQLVEENLELRVLNDKILAELNDKDNYIQKYITAKTQLGYITSVIKKTKSLAMAENFIADIEKLKEE